MFSELLALLLLSMLSVYDLKQRELPVKHTITSVAIAVIARLIEGVPYTLLPLKIYIIIDALVVGAVAVVALLGSLGWGDVFALAIIAIASPAPTYNLRLFPPVLASLAYYIAIILVFSLVQALHNIALHRSEVKKLPLKYKIAYVFIARPIPVSQYLNGKARWWYPLSICGKYKLTFNIYMNPEDVVKEVHKALKHGCIKRSDYLWSTYGIPALPLFTASYAAVLIAGDKPLVDMLKTLIQKI